MRDGSGTPLAETADWQRESESKGSVSHCHRSLGVVRGGPAATSTARTGSIKRSSPTGVISIETTPRVPQQLARGQSTGVRPARASSSLVAVQTLSAPCCQTTMINMRRLRSSGLSLPKRYMKTEAAASSHRQLFFASCKC